jgi:hypothetical protein
MTRKIWIRIKNLHIYILKQVIEIIKEFLPDPIRDAL